jgi:hypothetical protein
MYVQVSDAEGASRLGGGLLGEPPPLSEDQPVGVALQGREVIFFSDYVV